MNTNKTQPVSYKPFRSQRQHLDWIHQNCDSCKKGFHKKDFRFRCQLEFSLCLAIVAGDGVPTAVAKAIGLLDNEGCDLWECPGWERR